MNKYTIPCTEQQTRKALELGAPIESESEYQFLANQEHGNYRGGTFQGLIECMGENIAIFGNEPNRVACIIPTSEQMLGWLDKLGISIEIYLSRQYALFDWSLFTRRKIIKNNKPEAQYYYTRKEATLAAVDAALDYLAKAKEEQQ